MASRVQMIRKTTIHSRTEVALSCRLTSHNHAPEGLIESLSDKVVLANSINRAGAKGDVIAQFINPSNQPLELAAGLTIRTFTNIDQQDITKDGGKQLRSVRCTPMTSKVSDHLESMYQKACQDEVTREQASHLAALLTQYQAVFS